MIHRDFAQLLRASFCLAVVLVAGCSRAAAPPVLIGHVAPLGEAGGEQAVRAVQLALQSADLPNVTVHHADSARASAGAQATRLLSVNRAAALIVGPGVGDVEAVLPLARSHEAPVVILDEVADDALAGPAILLGPSPKERGRALAQYARKPAGRALVVADQKDRVCAAVAAAFTEAWREAGGTITELESDRAGLSVVLLALPAGRFRDWLEAAKGLEATILYGGPDADRPAGVRLPFVEATAFASGDKLAEAGRDWAKRFAERFMMAPGRSALLAADGAGMLLSAVRESGRNVLWKMKRDLDSRVSFDGLAGEVRWKDGRPLRLLYLVREAGGKREVLEAPPR